MGWTSYFTPNVQAHSAVTICILEGLSGRKTITQGCTNIGLGWYFKDIVEDPGPTQHQRGKWVWRANQTQGVFTIFLDIDYEDGNIH